MRPAVLVFLIGLITFSFSSKGQNDSARRKVFFVIGAKASVVHCDELFGAGGDEGRGKLRANGEGYVTAGVTSKRVRVTLGLGYAKYLTTLVQTDRVTPYTYHYNYEFYLTKLNVGFLLGKNSQWVLEVNTGVSRLFNFNKAYNEKPPLGDQKYNYEQTQNIFWGGISFGRSIKLTEHLNLDIVAGNNLSTRISPLSKNYYYYDRNTPSRNLWVKSLSLQLIYKI